MKYLILLTSGGYKYHLLYSPFISHLLFVLQNFSKNSFRVSNRKFHSIRRCDVIVYTGVLVFGRGEIFHWLMLRMILRFSMRIFNFELPVLYDKGILSPQGKVSRF